MEGTSNVPTGFDGSTDLSDPVPTELPFPYTVARTVVYLLLALVIAAFNSATIIVIVRSRSLRTVTNNFVISLSAADLLMTSTLLSYCCLIYVRDAEVWRAALFYQLLPSMLSSGVSLFTLLLVAVDRYVAVAHPFSYKRVMTVRVSRLLIVLVWGYFTVVITSFVTHFGYLRADSDVFKDHLKLSTALPGTLYQAGIQVHIGGALFVTILLYILTYRALQKQTKRLRDVTSAVSVTSYKTRRVTEMMVIIVVALVLCYAPITLFNFAVDTTDKHLETHLYYVDDLCFVLLYTNSFINPMVYAWKSTEFRHGYAQLWAACSSTPASQTDNRTHVETVSAVFPTQASASKPKPSDGAAVNL